MRRDALLIAALERRHCGLEVALSLPVWRILFTLSSGQRQQVFQMAAALYGYRRMPE